MTPKEKAKDLYFKMLKWQDESNMYIQRNIISTTAKQCSLIAINEMLDIRNNLYYNEGSLAHQYLLDIKQEIENL